MNLGINFDALRSKANHVVTSLNPFHRKIGVVMPDHTHLDGRRVFTAPYTQKSIVFQMLSKDQDFIAALPERTEDLLLILAVVGDEIRCNVFLVTENVNHESLHNPQWFNDGEFRYRMNPAGESTLVMRHARGYYHNHFDPYLSYSRPLTDEELGWVEHNRMH